MTSSTVVLDTGDELLRARRLAWIKSLESGDYEQGEGALFCQKVDYPEGYDGDLYVVPGTQTFCCLGVARDVSTPGWGESQTDERADSGPDYDRVSDFYGIPFRLKNHLMGMNDGESLIDSTDPFLHRRETGNERDFPFIARFLRKVWGLTDA